MELDFSASFLLALGVSAFVKMGVDVLALAFDIPSKIKPLIAFGVALLLCTVGYVMVPSNLLTVQAGAVIFFAAFAAAGSAIGMTELQKYVARKSQP